MAATMVTLRLLQGGHEEMSALQRVLEAAPVYAERVTGAPPGQADAQSMYSALPPGKCYDDKFVLGIYAGDMMIGCADLIRGCPDSNAALIGLLLLAEPWQRRGFGTAAYHAIEDYVRSWGSDWKRIGIGVVQTNAEAIAFWAKHGFVRTGEVKSYRYGNIRSETVVMSKALNSG